MFWMVRGVGTSSCEPEAAAATWGKSRWASPRLAGAGWTRKGAAGPLRSGRRGPSWLSPHATLEDITRCLGGNDVLRTRAPPSSQVARLHVSCDGEPRGSRRSLLPAPYPPLNGSPG